MYNEVFDFSIKISNHKGRWYVSRDPHLDMDCDVLYQTNVYVDANRFFCHVLSCVSPEVFVLLDKHNLQNGETLAIFRSQGGLRLVNDENEENKDE